MINVTEKAIDVLAITLSTNEAGEEQGLRLARNAEGQFGLALDEPREGDEVVKQEERPVLLVDKEVSSALDGAVLDVDETAEGARLTLRMPEER